MTAPCDHPIEDETLVAYLAGELATADEDAVEIHVFECVHCGQRAERLATVARGIEQIIPPTLTEAALHEMLGDGRISRVVEVEAGQRGVLPFESDTDVVICELRGDFRGHRLVDLDLTLPRGTFRIDGAPVAEGGRRVFMACQTEYPRRYGNALHLVVRPHGDRGEAEPLAVYDLDHDLRMP